MSSLSRMFENISVRSKLVLGFALVLLLTCVVAGAGWHSIDLLLSRSSKVDTAYEFQVAINKARGLRLEYLQTTNKAQANQLTALLENLQQRLQQEQHHYSVPADIALLKNAHTAAVAYQQELTKLAKEVADVGRQRQQWFAAGEQFEQQVLNFQQQVAANYGQQAAAFSRKVTKCVRPNGVIWWGIQRRRANNSIC